MGVAMWAAFCGLSNNLAMLPVATRGSSDPVPWAMFTMHTLGNSFWCETEYFRTLLFYSVLFMLCFSPAYI